MLKAAEAYAKEDLSDTEIITLSIGSNDVLGPFLQFIADELGCDKDEIQQTLATMTPPQLMNFLAVLNRNDGSGLIGNAELIKQANAFANNFQKIIQILKRLAPNAKIFVTNIYNPYEGFAIPYGTNSFDLGQMTDSYIQILNQAFDPNSHDYILIDVNSAFSESLQKGVNPVNADVRTFNFDPHPNKTGHRIIAELILGYYSAEPSVSPTSLSMKAGDSANLDIYYGKGIKVATSATMAITDSSIAVLSLDSVTTSDSLTVSSNNITVIGQNPGNTELVVVFDNSQNTRIVVPVTVISTSNDDEGGGGTTPGEDEGGGGATPGDDQGGGGATPGGGSGSTPSNGGGSSSGGSTPSIDFPIAPETYPGQPSTAVINVEVKPGNTSEASITIKDSDIAGAIRKAQSRNSNSIAICINITMPSDMDALTTSLSRNALEMMIKAGVTSLEINMGPISITMDLEKLRELYNMNKGGLSVRMAPAGDLPPEAQEIIGDRPAFEVTITSDNPGSTSSRNGTESQANGMITYAIRYSPEQDEFFRRLFGVYVTDDGEVLALDGSEYDPGSGALIIRTNHNSIYGVGYVNPSAKYTDITNHWAKAYIEYIVDRDLLSGTSETTFSPDTPITRGILVMALGKLAGVDENGYKTMTFSDVKVDSIYAPYIEWAYQAGVVKGVGNNQFEPDRNVTREEIAIIFERYAKATGYVLPTLHEAAPYADRELIGVIYREAVRAMQQAGIMTGGPGNRFNPKGNVTRAEFSAILDRYIKLITNPKTAHGWVMNNAGQYFYYKDGQPLTGEQTINGVKYFFDTKGILKTGWVKDSGQWRYYSDNKMVTGWMSLVTGGSSKIYHFTEDGLMLSKKWHQIDGKWYYFYADGTLARNTRVDGYEVDENGVRKAN